ncbi:unnamed protein product [Sphagnum troendelagicum]|uniref:Mediator of RNA polymerase II transcription subunit 28 n=2 Tax=Sphagnum TaxID=13804 RepID=A0ABP0U9T5_9BRYO|nr:hypothetical protein BDL97_02G125900 [Sphagnum fallax]
MMVAAGADLQNLVAALDAALLPCLPARELQAADRSTHPSHQVDVERHARDFMETAKSLQLFFIKAQHQHKPTREEALRKELATLEAELKAKDALIEAQKKLLQSWQGLLQAQRNVLVKELEQV